MQGQAARCPQAQSQPSASQSPNTSQQGYPPSTLGAVSAIPDRINIAQRNTRSSSPARGRTPPGAHPGVQLMPWPELSPSPERLEGEHLASGVTGAPEEQWAQEAWLEPATPGMG